MPAEGVRRGGRACDGVWTPRTVAGFGALAIPLGHVLPRVTALEPAPAMPRALETAVRRERLANLRVIAWRV